MVSEVSLQTTVGEFDSHRLSHTSDGLNRTVQSFTRDYHYKIELLDKIIKFNTWNDLTVCKQMINIA